MLCSVLLGPGIGPSGAEIPRALEPITEGGDSPAPGASPHPIIVKLLNYRDHDAALRHARELKTLQYEGMTVSLYPDFTMQVQEARRKFIAGKKQLRNLHLEYRMLYPVKLRVEVDGSPIFFTDYKKLDQFVKRRAAGKGSSSVDDADS
ncbi:hypothetical protein NDU88_001525 [Pleurodeles waltl]|uniref:Uncharacterized protein n=1 Tax=Pleurodeles waltl TaxID=8319 RepID=A0AAV7UT04_PLEWA|nr:hypothetical protein NDU88_001525 [Pleurodeles waltl]